MRISLRLAALREQKCELSLASVCTRRRKAAKFEPMFNTTFFKLTQYDKPAFTDKLAVSAYNSWDISTPILQSRGIDEDLPHLP